MKRIIVLLFILLAVLTVACQPQAKVAPTPDMVHPVAVQEAGAIIYVNNSNLNQTNLEILPSKKANDSSVLK